MVIRAVLVDGQAVVQAGFRILLGGHGGITVVGGAAGGRETVTVIVREHSDVMCMGPRMPARDGLAIARQIVAPRQGGSPAMLVVTTFDLDADVFGTLEARADGFILKDYEPGELVGAVHHLAARCRLVDHIVTRRVIAEFAHRHTSAGNATGIRRLTTRELEIMKLLAVGMSNVEIAIELMIETSTVKLHLTQILLRIGARDRVQAVVQTHRNSLVG